MLELTEWSNRIGLSDNKWLILGKGPTFQKRQELNLEGYHTIGLNDVVTQMRLDVASAIDTDVLERCGDIYWENAGFLLMPRYPHFNCKPDLSRPLESLMGDFPILRRLSDAGRLVWYNLASTVPEPNSLSIPMCLFSSEVMVNILGILGVKEIRTLGIDGGPVYAPEFNALHNQTFLSNGQRSYNIQFANFAIAAEKYDLDCRPLIGEFAQYELTPYDQIVNEYFNLQTHYFIQTGTIRDQEKHYRQLEAAYLSLNTANSALQADYLLVQERHERRISVKIKRLLQSLTRRTH